MKLCGISAKCVIVAIVLVLSSIVESCGVRKVQHETLITHGFETKPGSFPWHVAIYHRESINVVYKCGGTLINENTIITAAHCGFDKLGKVLIPQRMIVHLGKHKLFDSDVNTREATVKRIEIHAEFNASTLENDIAKVHLSDDLIYTHFIQPICLWDRDKTKIGNVEGKRGTVAGWGYTEKDETSDVLREAIMPVVPLVDCLRSNRNFFGNFLSNKNFCAGFRNGTSVCNGDSGGGMYFEQDGVWKLRGVVSISTSRNNSLLCNTKEYVLFTDAAQYLEWIRGPPSGRQGCGQWTPRPGLLEKNVEPLIPGDFPWSAAIYSTKDNKETLLCGGSLINSNTVLSVAHCVIDYSSSKVLPLTEFVVRLGTTFSGISSGQSFNVNAIKSHENYKANHHDNDIALLTLSSDATFSENIQPICLKDFGKIEAVATKPGYYASLSMQSDSDIRQLTMARVNFQDYSECYGENNDGFHALIVDSKFCAKYADPTIPCLISGGAYAVQDDEGSWNLKGVLSVGQVKSDHSGCDTSKTVLFSDIRKFSNWLPAEVRSKTQTCGLRRVSQSSQKTINRGEFPWNAIIYYRKRMNSEYRCGGTLIHKNIILTVAHCMYDYASRDYVNPDRLTVHLGKYKIHRTDLNTESMQVFKIIPHSGFNRDNNINDIALLVLANDVRLSAFIQPVCLWEPSLTERIDDQTLGQTLSWGKLFFSEEDAEDPRRASMRIVVFDKCLVPGYASARHLALCAGLGNGTETVCRGDSGAGMTFDFGGVSYLKGIVSTKTSAHSREDECNAESYVIYTDVEKYLPWINGQIKDYVV